MHNTKTNIVFALTIFLLVVTARGADTHRRRSDTDKVIERGVVKLLRQMVNQTNADTLNLPANSTSIRENITDTFSCENRTYGYYADVDNDCQVFHVCLPTTAASGRNLTYRWSFICPKETIFNQEVLVCTRSREAIPCEESPMFYDRNLEIGKVQDDETNNNMEAEHVTMGNKHKRNKNRRKEATKNKQNIIVEKLMNEAMRDIDTMQNIDTKTDSTDAKTDVFVPVIEDVITELDFKESDPRAKALDSSEDTNSRIFGERSMKNENYRRIGFRFSADAL